MSLASSLISQNPVLRLPLLPEGKLPEGRAVGLVPLHRLVLSTAPGAEDVLRTQCVQPFSLMNECILLCNSCHHFALQGLAAPSNFLIHPLLFLPF